MNALALIDTLDGLGVQVTVTSAGKVRLTPASRVDPVLLDEVRACRLGVLALLKKGNDQSRVARWVDWITLAQQPGHCGSCMRFTPTFYPLEGECSAGRVAHGWEDGNPSLPVLIHPAHQCVIYGGKGYRRHNDGIRVNLNEVGK